MNGQDCDQLTLFPADSPASHFPWLESKKVKGMTATYGLKCSELSESLRRVGYSVRTYLESCELPPGTWLRTWSARALTSRCLILKLRLSARSTGERESRLLPTLIATDATANARSTYGRGNPHLLTALTQAKYRLLPTPVATDWKGGARRKDGSINQSNLKEYFLPFCDEQIRTIYLNPQFLEQLMGFPIGWTALDASETP